MYPYAGPEYQQLTRRPVVTLAIMGIAMLAFVPTRFMSNPDSTALHAALGFRMSRPWLNAPLDLSLLVLDEQDFAINMKAKARAKPADPAEVAALQQEMDQLAKRAVGSWNWTPYRLFSFQPSRPTLLGLVFHPLFSKDFVFLLINLLFLGICGSFLEELWGRIFYPVFLFVGSLVTLLVYVMFHPGIHVPLSGPMGATAAAIGAFTVFYFTRPVQINLSWAPNIITERTWPTMSLFPVWFVGQTVLAHFFNPPYATPLFASVVAFLFGVATVLVIKHFELGTLIHKTEFDRLSRDQQLQVLIDQAHAENDKDAMFSLSLEAFQLEPDRPEFQRVAWETAVGQGKAPFAYEAGARWIRHLTDEDKVEEAFACWLELAHGDPGRNLHLDDVGRLIHGLLNHSLPDSANRLAAYTAQHLGPGGSSRTRKNLLQAFDFVHPALNLRLIRRIKGLPDVGEKEMEHLDRVEADLMQMHPGLNPDTPVEKKTLDIAAPHELNRDAPSAIAFEDTFALTRIQVLQVYQGLPESLDKRGLSVTLDQGAQRTIGFKHMKGVAMAAIRELGGQPYVLLDLLVDHPLEEKSKHVLVRMNMRRFNPMDLVPDTASPAVAAKSLAAALLQKSGAHPLPDEERLLGERFLSYPSLEAFETEIYGVTSR